MLTTKIYFINNVQHINIKLINDTMIIGLLHAIVCDNICNIISLNVNERYQNKGYGSILLSNLIDHCKNNKITCIMLDDMSDRFNQKNNIYLNFGFNYITSGFPEMELIL